jgi:hypothetical protein
MTINKTIFENRRRFTKRYDMRAGMDPSEQTRDGAETPGGLALARLRADIVSARRKGRPQCAAKSEGFAQVEVKGSRFHEFVW